LKPWVDLELPGRSSRYCRDRAGRSFRPPRGNRHCRFGQGQQVIVIGIGERSTRGNGSMSSASFLTCLTRLPALWGSIYVNGCQRRSKIPQKRRLKIPHFAG
jgi:hypothetical protein